MFQSIRSVLAIPAVYRLWASVAGGPACIKTLVEQHIKPETDARILEIGCGPGNLLPYLPQSGYLGFDISSEYIEQARNRFPNAQFICDRVSKFSLPQIGSFDVTIAIGIVHHLDDSEARQLFQIAYDALRPGGKLVTLDGVLTRDQSAAARWFLSKDRGEYVRYADEYVRIASQVFGNVKPIIRDDLIRVPYTHLILECMRPAVSETARSA